MFNQVVLYHIALSGRLYIDNFHTRQGIPKPSLMNHCMLHPLLYSNSIIIWELSKTTVLCEVLHPILAMSDYGDFRKPFWESCKDNIKTSRIIFWPCSDFFKYNTWFFICFTKKKLLLWKFGDFNIFFGNLLNIILTFAI